MIIYKRWLRTSSLLKTYGPPPLTGYIGMSAGSMTRCRSSTLSSLSVTSQMPSRPCTSVLSSSRTFLVGETCITGDRSVFVCVVRLTCCLLGQLSLSFMTQDCQMVATAIRSRIEEFHPYIPLIQGLRNPGMKSRHWELLSERIQMKVKPKANLTFSRCLELGLQNHVDDIAHVAEVAGKEYTIEQVPFNQSHTHIQAIFILRMSQMKKFKCKFTIGDLRENILSSIQLYLNVLADAHCQCGNTYNTTFGCYIFFSHTFLPRPW